MVTGDAQFVRFLQQECSRLRDENQVLVDEVSALRRYIRALQAFEQRVQRFSPEQDVLTLLDETLEYALELLDADDVSLMLVDEETDDLVFALVHGTVHETLPGYRFGRQQGIAGWVAEQGEPVIVNAVRSDPRFMPEVDERFGFVTQSLVAVPLVARGRVLGVIEVLNKRSGEPFSEEDAGLLSILATLAAFAIDDAASVDAAG